MFIISIIIVCLLRTVIAFFSETQVLNNLTITPFLDGNRHIRLNLTWDSVEEPVEQISIMFVDTDPKCTAIDGAERVPIRQETHIIFPSLNLTNPADSLANGCEYNVIVETHDLKQNFEQSLLYQIPDCVQDRCKCKNTSPYKMNNIIPLYDDVYRITWEKLSSENLTLLFVFYRREDNNTGTTQVKEINSTVDNAIILLPDLKNDVNYRIIARFSYDGCNYQTSMILNVPAKRSIWSMVLLLALSVIFLTLFLFAVTMSSVKLRTKLKNYKKHIYCCDYEGSAEDPFAARPLSPCSKKEELNILYYKPVETDKYEFPRHKLLVKKILGEGTFGVVYLGRAYGLNNKDTEVAVKQLKEGSPEEELNDLKNEIKILKRVGGHKHVVSFLGCVTIDKPYLMLLELVTGGSLKQYLLDVREKWSKRKSRIFFADDMRESWQPNNKIDSEQLKYSKVVFENSDTSYITPDNLTLDVTAYKSENDAANREYMSQPFFRPPDLRRISDNSEGPQSPTSIASSALLSCADTDVTTMTSLPATPVIVQQAKDEYVRRVEPLLDNSELQQFARQISLGMEYLERIRVTHRDLAARNILITNDKVLKISDFGLSRVGTYVSKQMKQLPLRWMSIEAIEERIYTNKSDVWSFGVVLWEIGTLGAFPYPRTDNNRVLYDLKMGKRLERPKICTDELYDLMLKCWSEKPEDRPTFAEIVDQLDSEKKKAYVDFDTLHPAYVFPPAQEPKST